MAPQSYIFALALLFLFCVQNGFGLDCYQCNSHNDTRCLLADLPDELVKPCPEVNKAGQKYILCRKIKQIIDFEVNGLRPDTRVIRSCGFDDSTHKNKCYQRSGFGGRQEVCACEENNCNSSSSLAASLSLLLGTLAFIKVSL